MNTSDLDRHILLEAEEFADYGGWTLDAQFEVQMGSPYLLAHGLGRPVADARTAITVQHQGTYSVWVRAKDWVPEHHPGQFAVSINGTRLETVFGANSRGWSWESAGTIELPAGQTEVILEDLTGFDGRCDAIYLSLDDSAPPAGTDESARSWRRRLRRLPATPIDAGAFDVVIVGGGIAGSAAALTAARLGIRVAVVHNRPVLGGNASVEIGLTPRGETGALIKELSKRDEDGDIRAMSLLRAEHNTQLFMEHQVYDVATENDSIISIDAREARSGVERRFTAPIFIDCSGTAILGLHAGAETMFGHESKGDYNEPLAPDERLNEHHGHTVFFRTSESETPSVFPDVPWAVEVARDFANLSGQLERPGVDNAPGPVAGPARNPDPDTPRRMLFPATHFWEYGQYLDPYTEGEHIRDHLLCAIYGTFSNVKTMEPDTWANLELEWVAYVAGQGEFRRYLGDHVLTENDIRQHRHFDDAVALNSGAFCLHYPIDENYDFRLKDWTWDTRDDQPFEIPFRSLYSTTVPNLMMAGKHISVTHIAGSVTKFLGNGGQHAIATAAAASLCLKHNTTPRHLHEHHLAELKTLVAELLGDTPVDPTHSDT